MTDTSKPTEGNLHVSVSYPMGEPTRNGRVYPAEVMHAAMLKAQKEGTLKVRVDPDVMKNKRMSIGGKTLIDPKFTLRSMSMNEDGSLSGSFDVEERAGVVDRLADVAREDEEA